MYGLLLVANKRLTYELNRVLEDKLGRLPMYVTGPLWNGLPVLLGCRKRISRMEYLLRMTSIIEEGGSWKRCVAVHLLSKCHDLPALPMTMTAYDVRQVGSRAAFLSRPETIRGFSLFSGRLNIGSVWTARIGIQHRQGFSEALKRILSIRTLPPGLSSYKVDESDPPVPREATAAHYLTMWQGTILALAVLCLARFLARG
mmetsp:Transcript_9636/g.27812  ORF Transcript_9636/g.27812 Transcript_9636/m.27812 type:complete len:201 (+) Transcript_9636:515-1117(+)